MHFIFCLVREIHQALTTVGVQVTFYSVNHFREVLIRKSVLQLVDSASFQDNNVLLLGNGHSSAFTSLVGIFTSPGKEKLMKEIYNVLELCYKEHNLVVKPCSTLEQGMVSADIHLLCRVTCRSLDNLEHLGPSRLHWLG